MDIRTGRKAAAGASGAVSLPGTAAALAGAALLGTFVRAFGGGWGSFALVTGAGFAGAVVDSLLGATVQAQWRDPADGSRWTEQPQAYPPARGRRGVGNNGVKPALHPDGGRAGGDSCGDLRRRPAAKINFRLAFKKDETHVTIIMQAVYSVVPSAGLSCIIRSDRFGTAHRRSLRLTPLCVRRAD